MDLMERRRELIEMQGELPGAYRKVDCLKSTGNQYIDLNTSITNGMPIFATVMLESNSSNLNIACFGGRTSGTENNVQFNVATTTQLVFDYGNYQINRKLFPRILDTFFDVEFRPYTISVNGVTQSVEPLSEPFATPKTYLFNCYNKYSGVGWIGRIAYFRLGSVRNCIPCVRKSDNKPGMYDTVSKTFFTNAGTGEFIVPEQ